MVLFPFVPTTGRMTFDVFLASDNPAGGSPAASHFSCLAKKSNQKKSPPVCRPFGVPCVARLVRRLRNSHCVLKQSSPTPPDQPALLGGAQGRKSKIQNHRMGTSCPPYLVPG